MHCHFTAVKTCYLLATVMEEESIERGGRRATYLVDFPACPWYYDNFILPQSLQKLAAIMKLYSNEEAGVIS